MWRWSWYTTQKTCKLKPQKLAKFVSFEYTEICLTSLSQTFPIIVVYQPPPASTNCFTVSMFIEEFSRFLEQTISTSAYLLILGDFNFHVKDNTNYEAGPLNIFWNHFFFINMLLDLHTKTDIPLTWLSP